MASGDVWVRALVKFFSIEELEEAQRCILNAEASRVRDVVQITSQSSRAGSASGISIAPDERADWMQRIEEALGILTGDEVPGRWRVQDMSGRTFGT